MKLIFWVAIGIVFAVCFLVAPLPTMILGAVFGVAWAVIAGVAALIGAIVEEPARHRAEKAKRAAAREKREAHAQLARAIGALPEPPPKDWGAIVLLVLTLVFCGLALLVI